MADALNDRAVAMAKSGERARGGGDTRKSPDMGTLSSIGVTKKQSARWQDLARISESAEGG